MKPKKLFSVLFPSYFLISLVGLSVLLIIARYSFKNFYFEETSTNLIQKAKLVEEDTTNFLIKKEITKLQRFIKAVSNKSQSRISIILPTGLVVADSSYAPHEMSNHLNRDEITSSLNGKIGKSIRYSIWLKIYAKRWK